MPEETAPSAVEKTCFVVMGFGEKVDFQTGRKLNLDASYHNMIKPAVEDAGLKCVRADEIIHSGIIDVPMYEQLLQADIVIADLSTYNPNAFYELGVRHALRPFSTIVIAEDKLNYPFDVNHIVIRKYRHLGDDIGVGDARKFSAELKQALAVILAQQENDSPVYQFLNGLTPPEIRRLAKDVAAQAAQAAPSPQAGSQASDITLHVLMQQANEAIKTNGFAVAKQMLGAARALKPEDPYIIQRLAFATYKDKQLPPQAALEEAREMLTALHPETSNDTETLGLWGAVHKRLLEITGETRYLDEAVHAYERGFYIRNDYYNGINLAFLLNARAADACQRADSAATAEEATAARADAVACFVRAERVRREVLSICEATLADENLGEAQRYWPLATMAEAYLGIGDKAASEQKLQEAFAIASEPWMKEGTEEQMDKLRGLLTDSPLKYIRTDEV